MFDPRRLDESISVAPQIDPADLPAIRAAGFATVVNNRPDHEELGQPDAQAIRAAAQAAGLAYHEVPVGHGGIGHAQLDAMAAALSHGPTLAFCRSGTRSCHLWALTRAKAGDDPAELTAQAAAAGYDLAPLAQMLAMLGPAMSWLQLGGSIAAILSLAGLARWLKLGESRIADDATARRFAEDALAGFVAGPALVAPNGDAALVAGGGAVAVLKRHGAQVAVRRLIPPLTLREAIEGVTIDTGERMFGSVTLHGIVADQVRGLEADAAQVYRTVQ